MSKSKDRNNAVSMTILSMGQPVSCLQRPPRLRDACLNGMKTKHQRSIHSGYTLIEAIATMVVLAALGSLASTIIIEASNGYLSGRVQAQLHTESSIAMDRIVRELRTIPLDDEANDTAPDIDEVTDTSITWSGDNHLTLNGTTLELVEAGGAPRVLLTGVSAFTIQTYDENNSILNQPRQASQCDSIRRVQVTITLSRHGESETLRTKVFVRSTMAGVNSAS